LPKRASFNDKNSGKNDGKNLTDDLTNNKKVRIVIRGIGHIFCF